MATTMTTTLYLPHATAYPLTPRNLAASQHANDNYYPFKIFISIFGVLALLGVLSVIGWFAYSRYKRGGSFLYPEMKQSEKDVAMAELPPGSQYVKGEGAIAGADPEQGITERTQRRWEVLELRDEDKDKRATRWLFSRF